MAQEAAFQKQIQRIGEMVEQLESFTDPNARAMTKEIIESLMALHGAALEKILELAFASGEPGELLIRTLGHDELVSSVLLLYGLHPEGLQTRATRTLEKLRNFLASHSATAELLPVSDDGVIRLRLDVKSGGCGSSGALVKSTLEASLQNAVPDAASIVIEESGVSLTQSGFVSITQLENGKSITDLYAARAERSGD